MQIQTSDQAKLRLGIGNFTCNWGVHMCGLYETPQERDEIILGFLHEGDEAGDLQLYCPVERTQVDFRQAYGAKFPCCADHTMDPDCFQFVSVKDLYYPDGVFSPCAVDRNLNALHETSQSNGRRHIRAAAEMLWAKEAIPGIEDLMAYESRLNYFISDKPWFAICMYNVTVFTGQEIMSVLRTHPYIINGGVITENPYFIDPEEFLSEYAPSFLNKTTYR